MYLSYWIQTSQTGVILPQMVTDEASVRQLAPFY